MLRYLIYTIVAIMPSILHSQNIQDVLRYSILNPTGTAASVGIGSVGGSFGGDFSTMHVNPAGLADYRDDAFVFTPMVSFYSGEAKLTASVGGPLQDSKTRFGVGNIGYVSTTQRPTRKLTRLNVAIGFSRMMDFNDAVYFEGSTEGSYLDYLVLNANADPNNLNAFDTQLGLEAGAIIFDPNFGDYFSDLESVDPSTPIYKEQTITTTGSMNELNLTVAGRVGKKFNFGFHLGMPIVNFDQTKTYREEGPGDISPFENLSYVERLSTSGVGVNFKTGIQYAVTPQWRLGVAAHSPTAFALTDDFVTSLDYTYFDESTQGSVFGSSTSPDGTFRYRVTNPWRFVASTGFVYTVGDIKGFITGDVEFVNYAGGSLALDAFDADPSNTIASQQVNRDIDNQLGNAMNFRIGSEVAIQKIRLRLGLGLREDPFAVDAGNFSTDLSAGIGFRFDGFFIDVGLRRFQSSEIYYPYFDGSVSSDPRVDITRVTNNVAITTGFTF
jgi:hypothetical protein